VVRNDLATLLHEGQRIVGALLAENAFFVGFGVRWGVPVNHNGAVSQDLSLDSLLTLVLLLVTLGDPRDSGAGRVVRATVPLRRLQIGGARFRDKL